MQVNRGKIYVYFVIIKKKARQLRRDFITSAQSYDLNAGKSTIFFQTERRAPPSFLIVWFVL